MIRYSVVIPHHNIPRLLERCLSSIPQRDDLEIIIVDDNSDASLVDFSHFPGQDRSSVHIIFDKAGRGAGNARNIGIEAAKGDWIIFADADDFFNPCFNEILDQYADADYDAVFFGANSVDTDSYWPASRTAHLLGYIQQFEDEKTKIQGERRLRYRFGEPWARFVKRSLIEDNDIRFDMTPIHEDTLFCYTLGLAAKNIKVDRRCIYCVTERAQSLSHSVNRAKQMATVCVFAQKEKLLGEAGIKETDWIHYDVIAKWMLSANFQDVKEGWQSIKDKGFSSCHIAAKVLKRTAVVLAKRILTITGVKSYAKDI